MMKSTTLFAGTTTSLVRCGFLFVLSCVLTACLDGNNGTVVLPTGTISKNVIPDEIRGVLENKIPIYEGNDAPNISGYYLLDDVTSLYCADEGHGGYAPGHKFADKYIYFGPQNKSGIIYEYEDKQGKSTNTSHLVQVMGQNNNFTAFYVSEGNTDYNDDGVKETWTKVSTVISGTITGGGITNYKEAIIMVDKNDPLDVIMDVNVYRVFYEEDGLVERVSRWNAPVKRISPSGIEDECRPTTISRSDNSK